jgi:hypothetical protein
LGGLIGWAHSLTDGLLPGEFFGIIAVAIMGKSGYAYIKQQASGLIREYGPPRQVGRLRYNIGLVMFSVPVLFGWVSPYIEALVPGFMGYLIYFAVGGDILFLVSLFVLGGEFWDKIRSLFVHDMQEGIKHIGKFDTP